MPTYEYGCSACGQEWEEAQRITAPPTEICPKCGKPTAHRLISAGTNFILKGGGWYSDLYSSAKSGDKKPASNGATKTDTTSAPATETKTETKSATPSTPPPTPSTGSSST